MTPEFWAIIGAALYIGYAIGSRADRLSGNLQDIHHRLYDIEELIGRIPGVEDYIPPDGSELNAQLIKNPDANRTNRRNWMR